MFFLKGNETRNLNCLELVNFSFFYIFSVFHVHSYLWEVSICTMCNGLNGEQGCHFKNDGLRDKAGELEIIKWITRMILHSLISRIPVENNGSFADSGTEIQMFKLFLEVANISLWSLFVALEGNGKLSSTVSYHQLRR